VDSIPQTIRNNIPRHTVVSVIAESISKTDVAAVNTEIVDAIHKFDFPAVVRDAGDSFYDKGDSVPMDIH
jgi:hypothetical protein